MKPRSEDKYVIDLDQYSDLIELLDKSYKKENEYGVKSIYFDTHDFSLLKNSLNKKKFNHKFRLRKYTFNSETLFLEEKNKNINNETEKIRTEVGLDFNYKTESSLKGYHPKILIKYDRVSYSNSILRITVDKNIKYKFVNKTDWHENLWHLDFTTIDYTRDKCVLEIKYSNIDKYLDMNLQNIIEGNNLYKNKFSKYVNCVLDGLMKGYYENSHRW